jgi:hypothetical protein
MSARRFLFVSCCALALAACAGSTVGVAAQVRPTVPAPVAAPPPPPGAALPDGQWVYTQQYGWIWMPFDDLYTYVPPGGTGEPLGFVFTGNYGWTWVAAPWVWGYGPTPNWGRPGPDRFAWYRHGWWRTPQRWRYTAPPDRGRVAARPGFRPAQPPRPPSQPSRPPPQNQPQPGQRGGEARGAGGAQRPPEQGGGFQPEGAQR